MVGGGRGSQIGYSHRNAAQRDGLFQLTAGAFDLTLNDVKNLGLTLVSFVVLLRQLSGFI